MPFLDWVNKNQSKETAQVVPYHLLQKEQVYGCDHAASQNLLIQGDNLLALKALLPFYAGQVKCIFIDPPYNTKSAFEHYDDNLEHSQWLSMMYPRLVLLRDLLAEDGSIWVTIDDNESHYLKVLLDEVFGRRNFVANIVWQKAYTSNQTALHISNTHDHVLVYAKNLQLLKLGKVPRTEDQKATFKNPDEDPRGPWKAENLSAGKFYSAGQFPITGPFGDTFLPPKGRYWRCNEQQYKQWLDDGRITFGLSGKGRPMLKKYLNEMSDGLTPNTWWEHTQYGSNKEASIGLKALMGDVEVFGTPKPEKLLSAIMAISTQPGDLVLDSFLGSGTTAAVAHKMGRRYIGIEMGEHAKTHCLPRLLKVIEGEQGGISTTEGWSGGGGFSFYTLGPAAFDEMGRIRPDVNFETLAAYIWHLESGSSKKEVFGKPLLGVLDGTAYFLLYNGILGDRRPAGGNVLTNSVLKLLRESHPTGPMVVYGETSRLGTVRMAAEGITFKQIPYDVRMR